ISRKFQIPNIYGRQTVWENLALAGQPHKNSLSNLVRPLSLILDKSIVDLLHDVKLNQRLDVIADELSHGEKQWLEICMTLACQPRLLLLDEPTAGLTTEETQRTAHLIHQIVAEQKIPIIVIEHDIGFVRALNSQVTVLHKGHVLAEGSMAEIEGNEAVQSVYLGRSIPMEQAI
ncbi:MAG: ATP-binding cassette domain-containing protein, partial [Chloroflexota bacterium]